MNTEQLRAALQLENDVVNLSSDGLGADFGKLLGLCYEAKPITINQAELAEADGRFVITGTSSLFDQAELPVRATISLTEAGKLDASFDYQLIGEVRPTKPWKFSHSLPELPTPTPFIDGLELTNARFVVSTAAREDPDTGVALGAGINFVARMEPGAPLGILRRSLEPGPDPMVVSGHVRVPTRNERIRPSARSKRGTNIPGVHLEAPLELDLPLGKLALEDVRFRVYSPHSAEWMAKNTSFVPEHGYVATLRIPSAEMEVELDADLEWGRPRALFYARPKSFFRELGSLGDLVGGEDLSASLPAELQKQVEADANFRLTYLSLDLKGRSSLRVGSVTVEVEVRRRAATLNWKVWNDDILVHIDAIRFEIANPFGGGKRTITATILGRFPLFRRVTLPVQARGGKRGFQLDAVMKEGDTIPLASLVRGYAPGVSVPRGFDVTSLRLTSVPGKSYSMSAETALKAKAKPEEITVGKSTVAIRELRLDFTRDDRKLRGGLGGTATFDERTELEIVHEIPAEPMFRGVHRADRTLSTLIKRVTGTKLDVLPKGFDLRISKVSLLVCKQGGDYALLVGARVQGGGTLAMVVRKIGKGRNASWKVAIALGTKGRLSSLPGLGDLRLLEKLFPMPSLVAVISSISSSEAPDFSFPDMAQFGNPALPADRTVGLPSGVELKPGFCVYATWEIKGKKPEQLAKFLSLEPRVPVILEVGKNPLRSRLYVDLRTTIDGNPFVGQFGATLKGTTPALFLDGQLTVEIQDEAVEFSTTMVAVRSGVVVSGTMLGTVEIKLPEKLGNLRVSNLAMVTGVTWSGTPNVFGVAATIVVKSFSSSVALLFDASDRAKCMLAGSVSNLTLADLVKDFAGVEVNRKNRKLIQLLDQFGVEGLEEFNIPFTHRTALDELDAAEVAEAFKARGISIGKPEQVVLVVNEKGQAWQLTDTSHDPIRHYQLRKRPIRRSRAGTAAALASAVRAGAGAVAKHEILVTVDAQVYLAPRTTKIGKLKFKRGIYVEGMLEVLGVETTAKIMVSLEKGVAIDTRLNEPIVIKVGGRTLGAKFFELSDRSGEKGPHLSVASFEQRKKPKALRQPHFHLEGRLKLFGVQESEVLVGITSSGASFEISPSVEKTIGSTTVAANFDLGGEITKNDILVSGSVSVPVSGKLGLSKRRDGKNIRLGAVKLDVEVTAGVKLGVKNKKPYAEILAGKLVLNGESIGLRTRLSIANGDLTKAPKAIVDEIKGLLENPDRWAELAKDGFIAGFDSAEDIAKGLKNGFGKSAKATGAVLKGLGYGADEIGGALKNLWKLKRRALKEILKDDLGFPGRVVNGALSFLFDVFS